MHIFSVFIKVYKIPDLFRFECYTIFAMGCVSQIIKNITQNISIVSLCNLILLRL